MYNSFFNDCLERGFPRSDRIAIRFKTWEESLTIQIHLASLYTYSSMARSILSIKTLFPTKTNIIIRMSRKKTIWNYSDYVESVCRIVCCRFFCWFQIECSCLLEMKFLMVFLDNRVIFLKTNTKLSPKPYSQ